MSFSWVNLTCIKLPRVDLSWRYELPKKLWEKLKGFGLYYTNNYVTPTLIWVNWGMLRRVGTIYTMCSTGISIYLTLFNRLSSWNTFNMSDRTLLFPPLFFIILVSSNISYASISCLTWSCSIAILLFCSPICQKVSVLVRSPCSSTWHTSYVWKPSPPC